jgi:hypothetical protein
MRTRLQRLRDALDSELTLAIVHGCCCMLGGFVGGMLALWLGPSCG